MLPKADGRSSYLGLVHVMFVLLHAYHFYAQFDH